MESVSFNTSNLRWGTGISSVALGAAAVAGLVALFFIKSSDFVRSVALYGTPSAGGLSFILGALTYVLYRNQDNKEPQKIEPKEAVNASFSKKEKDTKAKTPPKTIVTKDVMLRHLTPFLDVGEFVNLYTVDKIHHQIFQENRKIYYQKITLLLPGWNGQVLIESGVLSHVAQLVSKKLVPPHYCVITSNSKGKLSINYKRTMQAIFQQNINITIDLVSSDNQVVPPEVMDWVLKRNPQIADTGDFRSKIIRYGTEEQASTLLSHNPRLDGLLHIAFTRQKEEIILLLLNKTKWSWNDTIDSMSYVDYAVKHLTPKVISTLLQQIDQINITTIIFALRRQNEEIILSLLSKEIYWNISYSDAYVDRYPLLYYAVEFLTPKVVVALLRKGIQATVFYSGFTQKSVLRRAVERGDLTIINALLDHGSLLQKGEEKHGWELALKLGNESLNNRMIDLCFTPHEKLRIAAAQ